MQDGFKSVDRAQRGFSAIVTTLLVGVMSVTALAVLYAIEDDSRLSAVEKSITDARFLAQGGMREVLNDRRLFAVLPSTAGTEARFQFTRPTSSEFWKTGSREPIYNAEVTLVRSSPALESSQRSIRVVLYELKVRGSLPSGQTSEIEALIYRLGSAPNSQTGAEVFGR